MRAGSGGACGCVWERGDSWTDVWTEKLRVECDAEREREMRDDGSRVPGRREGQYMELPGVEVGGVCGV